MYCNVVFLLSINYLHLRVRGRIKIGCWTVLRQRNGFTTPKDEAVA